MMKQRLVLIGSGLAIMGFSTWLLAMPAGQPYLWRRPSWNELGSRAGYASRLSRANEASRPRAAISVLETDIWVDLFDHGAQIPVAKFPIERTPLRSFLEHIGFAKRSKAWLRSDDFSPAAYLDEIAKTQHSYTQDRDVLLYYGGTKPEKDRHGLNLNGWTVEDLTQLRQLGCRPFIGLETWDSASIKEMVLKLKQAGYRWTDVIYVRVLSEPNTAYYGREKGKAGGKRDVPAAHAAYKERFAAAASALRHWSNINNLHVRVVFAGFDRADFLRYMPPAESFDVIGYDLYLTPDNQPKTFQTLEEITQAHPDKPLVLPELGVATAGPFRSVWRRWGRRATPMWGLQALGDVLERLGKHPAGVEVINVFSVNVAARMQARRWSWAWSPAMFAVLSDWNRSQSWTKEKAAGYDPRSYPLGEPVLYVSRPTVRIFLQRLDDEAAPHFLKIRYLFEDGRWIRQYPEAVTLHLAL